MIETTDVVVTIKVPTGFPTPDQNCAFQITGYFFRVDRSISDCPEREFCLLGHLVKIKESEDG